MQLIVTSPCISAPSRKLNPFAWGGEKEDEEDKEGEEEGEDIEEEKDKGGEGK